MKHRGQITHQQYRGGGPRFADRPSYRHNSEPLPDFRYAPPDYPETDACYCTGLRHEWDKHGCPAERVEAS